MASEPFGVRIGSPLTDHKVLEELGEGKYQIEPPRPYPLMARFIVQASKSSGVVWVKAISEIIDSDNYGNATRGLVDRIASQLSTKYGSGKKTDLLLHGSIWNEPKEWMNGLGAHERMYSFIWDKAALTSTAPDLASVWVGASGVNHVSGIVAIEYESVNLKSAALELDSEMADLL